MPGPFALHQPIGRGAMGEVWSGVHERSGLPVAIKIVRADPAAFAREIEAVAALDHPRIVWILDHGVTDGDGPVPAGLPWLAMQRASGTLQDHLPLTWDRQRQALLDLLEALAHAHARGFVHLDVKPSNVLVGCRRHPDAPLAHPTDGLCLADFGVARHVTAGPGATGGTPGFVAPEQADGERLGPWTDLYGVGAVAWALATGAPPPRGALHPPGGVPEGWLDWVGSLLAPEAGDRWGSAAAASAALAALGEAPAAPPRPPAPELGEQTTCAVVVPLRPARPRPRPTGARHPLQPLPRSWQGAAHRWPSAPLVDAGLGLIALREPAIVGRTQERDRLWSALRRTIEGGQARAVLLRGPSGVGVSRLGRWLAERAHEVGAAHVLQDVGLVGALRAWTDHVRSAQPDWARDELVAARASAGVVEAVLADAAGDGPVVVWLDDVHDDPLALARVREHLDGQDADPVPVLWLLAARDEDVTVEARNLLEELADRPDVEPVVLGPLPPGDHERLVQDALHLELSVALKVAAHTAGSPGFATSALRELVVTGALVPGPDGFVLRKGAALTLPADHLASGRRRLDAVAAGLAERRVLWLAAVLGDRATLEVLRAGAPDVDVADLRDRLVRAGLATAATDRLQLATAQLRQVLEAEAEARGVTAELHRTALAAWPHDPDDASALERRARHAAGAGELERALECWLDAGAVWRRDGVGRAKHRAAQQAWDLVERLGLPSTDRRHGLALGLFVHSMMRGRGAADHVAQCEALVEAAVSEGWADLEFEGRLFLGLSLFGTPRADETIDQLRRAGQVAEGADLWDRAVAAWSQLGHHVATLGRLDEAAGWFERCIEAAPRLDDPAWATVRGHCGLARIAKRRGDRHGALAHAERAVAASEGTQAQFGAFAAAVMSDALLGLDRPADAEPWVRVSIEYARQSGSKMDECRYVAALAAIQRALGRADEAEPALRWALKVSERVGGARVHVRLELALNLASRGDWAGAGAALAPDRIPARPGSAEQTTLDLLRLGSELAVGGGSDGVERVRAIRDRRRADGHEPIEGLAVAAAVRDLAQGAVRRELDRLIEELA